MKLYNFSYIGTMELNENQMRWIDIRGRRLREMFRGGGGRAKSDLILRWTGRGSRQISFNFFSD